jgi:hypothetical protein
MIQTKKLSSSKPATKIATKGVKKTHPSKVAGAKVQRQEKRDRCPAIKQVWFQESKSDDSFHHDISYHIPHSLYHDCKTVETISKYHPVELETIHRYDAYNRHPLCAAFRSIAEAHAISCIQKEAKAAGIFGGKICDIGGSVNRHFLNKKREFIHSCVPYFEGKDLMRQFHLKGKEGVHYCRQMWQDCSCYQFVASMSVHSLYYIEPRDMLTKLLRQELPVHYAVLHRYHGKSGSIMSGEMTFNKIGDKIKVLAKGNDTPYIHSTMDWMNETSYVAPEGTLVWELERSFEDVYVYRFVASPLKIGIERMPEEVVLDDDHEQYMELVHRSIRIGQPMSAKNRSAFLQRVERANRTIGLDPITLMEKADEYYMNQPSVLSNPSLNTRNSALKREEALGFNLEFRNLSAELVAALLVANWIMFYVFGFQKLMVSLVLSWMYLGSHFGFSVASTIRQASSFIMIWNVVSEKAGINLWGSWSEYFCDSPYPFAIISAVLTVLISKRYMLSGVRLLDYCCEGAKLRELSKRKCLKYKAPEFRECKPGTRAYPYVYHPDFVPMMPRRCDHNYDACIRHKVLSETPEDLVYDMTLPQELIDVAKAMELEPLDWDEWISRFPAAKQRKLREEKEELEQEIFSDKEINESSLFLKAEFNSEIKPPRPIHSSNVVLNFTTGRWLVVLGEALAKLLPEWIMFPIHGDSVEIGEFHKDNLYNSTLVQSDFSQFDSTQREESLNLILEFFELCGVPPHVVRLMRLDTEFIRVKTRRGFSYSCKGLRLSGRSETLLGNTVLTLSVYLHAAKGLLNAILVKGDDAVLYLRRDVRDDQLITIKDKVASLGLIAKFEVADPIDVEFCSSYFVPVEEGFILTPKPGKMLAKTFWCKNTQLTLSEQKDQFASILKGLKNNFGFLPFIDGLYHNEIYTERFDKVEAYRHQYNEYTDRNITCNRETVLWMMNVYDVSHEELCDLHYELRNGFPVKLSCAAAEQMITKDWAPPNYSKLLVEQEVEPVSEFRFSDVTNCISEEVLRNFSPLLFTCMLGLGESMSYGTMYNLVMHFVLMLINDHFGLVVACIVHVLHNFCVSAEPKLLLDFKKMVKKQRKGAKTRRRTTGSKELQKYANMIADPCNSVLKPGFHSTDEGVLSRLKTSLQPGPDDIAGFCLWCPTYMSDDSQHSNFLYFSSTASTNAPTNDSTDPLGSGASSGDIAGYSIKVGAGPFVASSTVADARCIGACMRLSYYGRMDACSGQLAIIENLPVTAILDSGDGSPITVDDCFQYSSLVKRFSIDTQEVTWRPDEISQFFKVQTDGAYVVGSGAASAIANEAKRFGPKFLGFAWRNISGVDDIVLDFVQNIEWRPRVDSGFVAVVPKQIHQTGYVEQAVKYLDEKYPGWTTTMFQYGKSAISQVARMALSGTPAQPAIRWLN